MAKQLQTFEFVLPINSLDNYIRRVNAIPLLSADEEQKLAEEFFCHQNLESARKLVMAHLRFVVAVARSYYGYGLAQADLIQEGNVGLMKAVKRFNPTVGVRLVSFAIHWIKAEIHEFILRNWRIVKMATTKAQRKLFFNLRKNTQHLIRITESDEAEVAKQLHVPLEEVQSMRMRMGNQDMPFESLVDDQGEKTWAPENYLEDAQSNPALLLESQEWGHNQVQALQEGLLSLDSRSREIISARWLKENKATLQDLAAKFKISLERIRQIEKTAMDKLKKYVEKS